LENQQNCLYAILALTLGFIGGTLAAEMVPAAALAARHARSVKAEHFILVDKAGAERVKLEVAQRETADLGMIDGSSRTRAEFRVSKDGSAAIALYEQNGRCRVAVGAAPIGRDGLGIDGSNGRQVAMLSATQSNESSLTLHDPTTGRARLGFGMTTSGAPALALFDDSGEDRLELRLDAKGNPGIALVDESGKIIFALPQHAALQP
jgi:hypothetical protein